MARDMHLWLQRPYIDAARRLELQRMIDWSLGSALTVAIVVLALFGSMVLVFTRALAAAARETEASLQRHYEVCEGFSELAAASAAMQRQIVDLTQRMEQTSRTPVVQQAPASVRAYELAARLAAGGAGTDDLVTSCGLTPAEAELAVLVHGTRQRAAH